MLLGGAVNVASAEEHFMARNAYNLAIRIGFGKHLRCLGIVLLIVKYGIDNAAVACVVINIGGRKSGANLGRPEFTDLVHAIVLFLSKQNGIRDVKLTNSELAPARIGFAGKNIVAGTTNGVLRIVWIIAPREYALTGGGEVEDVVNMAIRLIEVDTLRKPNNFLNVLILFKGFFNLVFRELRIATLGEQARLGDNERALAINMDGSALKNKIVKAVTIGAHESANL